MPINTDESLSAERMVLPLPADVRVRLPFEVVAIAAAEPPPRFNVVESIPKVAAASIVVRTPALIVVKPAADKVVSDAANVKVLLPESRVNVLAPPDVIDPAATKSSEFISRTVPSTFTKPRFPLSSIVMLPVPAATSNSEKLIAVAPPLIDVRDVPFNVVVPVKLTVSEFSPRIDPAPPLRGEIFIFPVVLPPIVKV